MHSLSVFDANFPVGYLSFLRNCNFYDLIIGNGTSCRTIRSVIILVINKSDSRCAVVRFCYHSYDYRPNWTPFSPITIKKQTHTLKLFSWPFVCLNIHLQWWLSTTKLERLIRNMSKILIRKKLCMQVTHTKKNSISLIGESVGRQLCNYPTKVKYYRLEDYQIDFERWTSRTLL